MDAGIKCRRGARRVGEGYAHALAGEALERSGTGVEAAGKTSTLVVRADERTRFLARNPERVDLTIVDVEAGANAAERATALDSELPANKDQP
jgi:hypothetical protein